MRMTPRSAKARFEIGMAFSLASRSRQCAGKSLGGSGCGFSMAGPPG
jgi:hypothetical protein